MDDIVPMPIVPARSDLSKTVILARASFEETFGARGADAAYSA
jgi:hypothetical protein